MDERQLAATQRAWEAYQTWAGTGYGKLDRPTDEQFRLLGMESRRARWRRWVYAALMVASSRLQWGQPVTSRRFRLALWVLGPARRIRGG